MSKTIESIKTWTRHNQGVVAAIVVCAMLLVWSGCEVTTPSPFHPDLKVTQTELEAEVQMYVVKVQSAYDDIQKQELIRKAILEAGWAVAQGGGVDFLGLGVTLSGIIGLGSIIDNRKKDAVIVSKSKALDAMVTINVPTLGQKLPETYTTPRYTS